MLLKHTLLHHTVKRLLVTNNGAVFEAEDWSRLKRIAEGNPDEQKIGTVVPATLALLPSNVLC